jgi:hypothetical protein
LPRAGWATEAHGPLELLSELSPQVRAHDKLTIHLDPITRARARARSISWFRRATLGQHSSGLDQFRRQVDTINPAAIRMHEIPRRPADATAHIENAALLRKCDPLSLIASGGKAARMEMLKCSEDFRIQILWVVSLLDQGGVDPRKHAKSRPMRLNIRRPFSHGEFE